MNVNGFIQIAAAQARINYSSVVEMQQMGLTTVSGNFRGDLETYRIAAQLRGQPITARNAGQDFGHGIPRLLCIVMSL